MSEEKDELPKAHTFPHMRMTDNLISIGGDWMNNPNCINGYFITQKQKDFYDTLLYWSIEVIGECGMNNSIDQLEEIVEKIKKEFFDE